MTATVTTMPLRLLYTTFASVEDARNTVRPMIELGLIACANLIRMDSLYCWKGDLCDDSEVAVILKTRPELEQKARDYLDAHHPYDTPCILSWAAAANAPYMVWVLESTESGGQAST